MATRGLVEPPPVVARLRNGTEVAAWLLKASPGVWDLDAAIDAGAPLDSWGLADTYRAELLAPGQPAAIWRTRGWRRPAGIAAVGHIGSAASEGFAEDDGFWVGQPPTGRMRRRVDIEVEVIDPAIALDDLASDPNFAGCEVIRAPRVSSPIAVTPTEWAAVLRRLG